MKTIRFLLPVLLFALSATAQKAKYTPKQQIDRARKAQVNAQTPPAAPPAAYSVNTAEEVNQKPDSIREGVAPAVVAPTLATEPQNSAGLGGAGTSGTATNTIGAPAKPTSTTPARTSNDQTLPPVTTPVVRDRKSGVR